MEKEDRELERRIKEVIQKPTFIGYKGMEKPIVDKVSFKVCTVREAEVYPFDKTVRLHREIFTEEKNKYP